MGQQPDGTGLRMEGGEAMRRIGLWIGLFAFALLTFSAKAQEYSGITGMMHVPTAEMAPVGTARVGVYFLPKGFLPDLINYKGEKYNTFNHVLAIAPFSWIELSYICTLEKGAKGGDETRIGYHMKDRHFAAKIRPLKEGKWWPAIALGVQDPGRTVEDKSGDYAYFQNFYITLSKHLTWQGHELGAHLAYRYYRSDYNVRWRGVAGGITYRPAFAKNCRAMVEYTGDDINVGIDCYLWKLLYLQACLQDGRHFMGGIALKIQL